MRNSLYSNMQSGPVLRQHPFKWKVCQGENGMELCFLKHPLTKILQWEYHDFWRGDLYSWKFHPVRNLLRGRIRSPLSFRFVSVKSLVELLRLCVWVLILLELFWVSILSAGQIVNIFPRLKNTTNFLFKFLSSWKQSFYYLPLKEIGGKVSTTSVSVWNRNCCHFSNSKGLFVTPENTHNF